MRGVEGFDKGAGVRGPFGDCGGGAAVAAGLVAEFPREDCGRGSVAVDDELDVISVGGLGLGVGEEGSGVSSEGGCISVDAAEVVPIIKHGEDELDAVLFCSGNGRVKACNAWKLVRSRHGSEPPERTISGTVVNQGAIRW